MKGGAVQVVKGIKPPEVSGEHHRLLCLTGEHKGTSYYIKSNRIVIGRSETADIKILDGKSSREHVEIVKSGKLYILTDLKSQNGTIVNDKKVKQHTLKEGDKIIIGQTVFKFGNVSVNPQVAKKSPQSTDKADGPENKTDDEADGDQTPTEQKNKKPLIFMVVIGLFAAIYLMEEESTPIKSKKEEKKFQNVTDEFTSDIRKKQEEENRENSAKLDTILQRGLRELREGNYFRALEEFNLALVMSPSNARASFYVNKTKQALDNEIEQNLIKARRDQESLKYHSSAQTYCNILRLLEGYSEDSRYKKAQEEIKQVEKKMGLSEGEIKCSNYGSNK